MNNKEKVISYMEKETRFNGSFSDIEHRINVQNIIIRKKERKGRESFNKLKIAFLCLTCCVLCFVGGYEISKLFQKLYYVKSSYIEFNSYEEMEEAYYYYQELYPEEEKTLFNIELDGVIDYEYRINGTFEYFKEEVIFNTFYDKMPEITFYYNLNKFGKINFMDSYKKDLSYDWCVKSFNKDRSEQYSLVDLHEQNVFIEFTANGLDKYRVKEIQSYILDKLSNL